MTTYTSLDAARADRAARKEFARRALLEWQDSVVASIELVADQAGVRGADAVVVFAATDVNAPDAGALEWEPGFELTSAVFASAGRQVRLSVSEGPRWQWGEAVELWDELRAVLAQVYGAEIPAGTVVDLERRVVYCFEPWYCPEIGVEPDAIFELESADDPPADPFMDLMKAAQVDVSGLDQRLEALLGQHQLPAPTRPGHEPGDCGMAGIDDFDGLGPTSD